MTPMIIPAITPPERPLFRVCAAPLEPFVFEFVLESDVPSLGGVVIAEGDVGRVKVELGLVTDAVVSVGITTLLGHREKVSLPFTLKSFSVDCRTNVLKSFSQWLITCKCTNDILKPTLENQQGPFYPNERFTNRQCPKRSHTTDRRWQCPGGKPPFGYLQVNYF